MRVAALAMLTVLTASVPLLAAPFERDEPLSDKIKKERQSLEKLKGEIKEKKQKTEEAQRKEASVLQQIEEADHRIRLRREEDRKSTRLNSSHLVISYAVFCLKKKKKKQYVAQ